MSQSELRRVQDDLAVMKRTLELGPPFTVSQVWGFLWLAFTGLLLLAISLCPGVVPDPWGPMLVLACWIALPVRSLIQRLLGKGDRESEDARRALPRFYSATVLAFGLVFLTWARLLELSWPVTMGMLFFIEALPLLMVSVAEPWRRSGIGLASALVACGLGVPFMHGSGFGLLLGAAIFAGCSLSAAILYWQLSRHESLAVAE